MRGREFFMKDAYSFDADDEGAAASYRRMFDAYCRVFRRMGLDFRAVEADTGNIGGSSSHEFMVIADSGEDSIASCAACGYAANVEKAEVLPPAAAEPPASADPPRRVETPGKRTIEEVTSFLGVDAASMIKALVFESDLGDAVVLVAGPYEANEAKVKNALGADWVRLASEERVREVTGAPSGFAGPVGLPGKATLLADASVAAIASGVAGANERDAHLSGVVPGIHFVPDRSADLRMVTADDPCPRCGAPLRLSRGIEVGHVFRLGTKYSRALKATFLDAQGKEQLLVMGCYGIGVGRTAAAAIEQHHDDDGIVWPVSIAPFEAVVVPVNAKHEGIMGEASRIGEELSAAGVEVLLDDRDERPGIKFKDADLAGVPARVTLGEKNFEAGFAEVRDRRSGETERVPLAEAASRVRALLAERWKECTP
jgi:prolyl-tRNA synthetase